MGSTDKLIEQVLVLRCQTGDRQAFAELIERYQQPLRYFVSRLLDDAQMTEDILQDIWLTVMKRICTLRDLNAFAPWLYRTARNKVYEHLRKRRVLSELNEGLVTVNNAQEDVFSPEDAAQIHRSLQRLRPEHKEVLMLRFLEQMSYDQIAQVVNCTIGTVRSRIHYAKRALKKEMET